MMNVSLLYKFVGNVAEESYQKCLVKVQSLNSS